MKTVKTRIKVGVPVRVHYAGEGDSMMIDRVVLGEDLRASLLNITQQRIAPSLLCLLCEVEREGVSCVLTDI